MHLFWERILLAILILASVSWFVLKVTPKIRAILAGGPDRPRTDNPVARLKRTAKEVLLQSRVVGGRPVVGLLHAAVFLGFVAFAPETIEHFFNGFGLSLLEPLLGPALPLYRSLMLIVAVMVSAGIVGLAFRRFVLVKTSPDPRSWTSALVALFILVLMVTYLNGMRATPFAERINWWTHALVILAFPHLIIRSKHFHIFLAPLNIFFRSDRLGDYVKLDLEAIAESEVEDITLGLETMRTLPWKTRMDLLACVECRRCTDNCPAALAGTEMDPRAWVLAGRKALFSAKPEDPVIGTVIGEEALGYCATCGACENSCAVGVEHLQVLVGAKRAQALATGKGVVASDFLRAIESHGNALRLPKSDRKQMLAKLGMPRFTGEQDQWLLWLGCVWGFNADQQTAVAALKTTLDAAGVNYGVLDDEPCCGHHSRRQGEEAQFQDLARQSVQILHEKNVRQVVTPCPHCLHTIKREHIQFNGTQSIRAVHHSELLAELMAQGRLVPRVTDGSAKATYHDPCYLARYEGITEAPRMLLAKAGVALEEMPRRRERTLCCGGGAAGFVREIKNEKRLDQARRAEIKASGASLLVTSCPQCRMMLSAAVDETRDIAEIVADSIRLAQAQSGLELKVEKGGPMFASTTYSAELAVKIKEVFEHEPQAEMQLLNLAGRTHFSGKLGELKHAADHLVETGELQEKHHGGGTYYHLGKTS